MIFSRFAGLREGRKTRHPLWSSHRLGGAPSIDGRAKLHGRDFDFFFLGEKKGKNKHQNKDSSSHGCLFWPYWPFWLLRPLGLFLIRRLIVGLRPLPVCPPAVVPTLIAYCPSPFRLSARCSAGIVPTEDPACLTPASGQQLRLT